MSSTELNETFNIGDIVVYPSQGVGHIKGTEVRNDIDYLRVFIHSSDMDVLLPLSRAKEFGLRHTASKEETDKALVSLSKTPRHNASDWKTRLQENQSLLKSGEIASVSNVVNSLYRRSKVKELPAMERKVYDAALSMLVDESSSVLGISSEDAKKLIFSKLEP